MFIIVPTGVNYAARRYPVVTLTLIGINVLAYLAELICAGNSGAEVHEWVRDNLWLTPSTAHWYNYITTLFVHDGFLHLLGNMVYLFLFGACVEDIIGRWKFTVFYLVGGICSALAHFAVVPGHFASKFPLGGASGAVSACIGGFLVLLPKTEIEFKYFFWFFRPFLGDFDLKAWIVITFWFLQDLLGAVLVQTAGTPGGVAFAAHVGGTCLGFGLIYTYDKLRTGEEEKRKLQAEVPASPEAATIFLLQGESQLGPYTASQVKQMLDLGAIPAEAFYWQDGMTEWQSISCFANASPPSD